MNKELLIEQLSAKSQEIRKGIIRYIEGVGVGHVGGALSMADIAVALYYRVLRWDPTCADWPQRDRLVLSKGHCCDALAAIFIDRGIYSFDEVVASHEQGPDTIFSMHPCRKFMPFYEASTGALGHGLSVAQGMALAARQYGEGWRTFCIVGDGELDEGSNWEAIMSSAHYRLGNLICILDKNQLQMTDFTKNIMDHGNLREKLTAFGWRTMECDGNNMASLLGVLDDCPEGAGTQTGKPLFIIANTVKGKGVSFMEALQPWHGGCICHEVAQNAVCCIDRENKSETNDK